MAIWALTLGLVAGAVALLILGRAGSASPWVTFQDGIAIDCMGVAFSTAGATVLRRLPGHRIGWLFLLLGFLGAFTMFGSLYSIRAYVTAPGSLPLGAPIAWLQNVTFFPTVYPYGLGLLLVIFPDGRLPGRRWRIPFWAATAVAGLGVLIILTTPGPITAAFRSTDLHLANPIGVLPVNSDDAGAAMWGALTLWLLTGGVAIVVRLRRSRGPDRQRLKWLAYAGVITVAGFVLGALPLPVPSFGAKNNVIFTVGIVGATMGIPTAMAVAILRHRLYDIDLVIRRTFVYGALGALITGVYFGAVVGIGALIGGHGGSNVLLAILATGVVAVVFQPARSRLQHLANRFVFGRRATPYEVLTELTQRMTGAYTDEELLPRLARLLVEATHAERSGVWIRVTNELRLAAGWPTSGESVSAGLSNGSLPPLEGWTEAFAVRHGGDLLGAISISERASEPLTDTERKVVQDLAAQAGLLLRNAALTADLRARLEDLRASRQRLVQAQDEERRRLERNLHDGAQQHLVALKVRLGMAQALAAKQPERLIPLLAELQVEADSTLATMRELAHGIYPPLLAERGLKDALESQARRATLPVAVEADGVGRYPQDVEAAIYFCCLEALQNVQKYARASTAAVRLRAADGMLTFEVSDDGIGFDPAAVKPGAGLANLRDRLDALNGDLVVDSMPGRGTRITGCIPVGSAMLV